MNEIYADAIGGAIGTEHVSSLNAFGAVFSSVTFIDNSSPIGGAVGLRSEPSLGFSVQIESCSFLRNKVSGANDLFVGGGALAFVYTIGVKASDQVADSTLDILDSTFEENEST